MYLVKKKKKKLGKGDYPITKQQLKVHYVFPCNLFIHVLAKMSRFILVPQHSCVCVCAVAENHSAAALTPGL